MIIYRKEIIEIQKEIEGIYPEVEKYFGKFGG